MRIDIKVPRLGWNMEQGTFLAWLKRDGDAVRAGEALYALEGDKAVQEIESLDTGTLRIAPGGPREGEVVTVGTLLGHLVADAPTDVERHVATPPTAPGTATSSPRARRVAAELGVDWRSVRGSGRGGRVRERDVRAVAPGPRSPGLPPFRRTIADRLMNSLRSTAPVTLTSTADVSNLVSLRNQFRAAVESEAPVPSYTDFLVKLAALVLGRHPGLNARWEGDQPVRSREAHIGIAVDVAEGLLVPVLRDAHALSLREVAIRSRALIERARQRKLTAEELSGGTFTVSNLGPWGIDAFTPILNYPECAILGVGRIERRPAVRGERIVPRAMMTLSLTFDHRAVDGAPAARFLDDLRKCLENPGPWLVT
jgi:pyruvate dehydrogenase E2 component (dihydrolipoamide acetyltransferase)